MATTAVDVRALSENIARVGERITRAARRAGRAPDDVRLEAVTKTHPAEMVEAALAAGLRDFGENRVEEAAPKMGRVRGPARWHMIGHVQSRKAGAVVAAGFELVHSVDSLKLARRLDRLAGDAGRIQPILLECNVSGEASKTGFAAHNPAEWATLWPEFEAIALLPRLRVRGLMTMAPIVDDPETARPIFARLRALAEAARRAVPGGDWRDLSMGMTDDFEAAIAEGATLVRIGRAIFGERA